MAWVSVGTRSGMMMMVRAEARDVRRNGAMANDARSFVRSTGRAMLSKIVISCASANTLRRVARASAAVIEERRAHVRVCESGAVFVSGDETSLCVIYYHFLPSKFRATNTDSLLMIANAPNCESRRCEMQFPRGKLRYETEKEVAIRLTRRASQFRFGYAPKALAVNREQPR